MKKLKTLGLSLLIILLQSKLVYAETIEEGVKSSKWLLNLGTGIVIGFLTIGIMLTSGGWLLDVMKQQKIKIYMEIAIYLVALLVPLSLALVVFNTIKVAAK